MKVHLFIISFFALLVGVLYLDAPQFGDDFTYWSYGYLLHEGTMDWSRKSFHQLRWPIWGLCWVGQAIFGYGLLSYYLAPMLFLMLGAVVAFLLGVRLWLDLRAGWACAVVFLFHPLLDANLTRPYPDIFEGVLGALAVMAWWGLMHAETRGRLAMISLACGLVLFIAIENRLTGVFFIPLLGCLTLLFHPRKLLRIIFPLLVFGLCLGVQMWAYHLRYDDWLHFLHANSSAKGKVGTEPIAIWTAPFRFLDTLHRGSDISPLFAGLAVLGCWAGWRRFGLQGRVIVAWTVLLYLAYSCAPQQIWPYRPMLRDAGRFLATLAIPLSILAIMGLVFILEWIGKWRGRQPLAALARRPVFVGVMGVASLAALSAKPGNRDFFNLGYVKPMREYLRSVPAESAVFTHHQMRILAHLIDDASASRMRWVVPGKWITEDSPDLRAMAAEAKEFWYVRKLAFMKLAKAIITEDEEERIVRQPVLAPWFDSPEREWQLRAVLLRGDAPDLIFYRRRDPSTHPALLVEAEAAEWKGILPTFPHVWKKTEGKTSTKKPAEVEWPIPQAMRGSHVRIEIQAASDEREAFTFGLRFRNAQGVTTERISMAPYLFREGGKEFTCISIPRDAQTALIRLEMRSKTDWLKVDALRLIVDPAP